MLPRSSDACQTSAWERELAQAFKRPEELLAALGLRASQISDLDTDAPDFRMLVPRGFAAAMTPGDPHDPLLRQVLPLRAEQQRRPDFLLDPVGDAEAEREPGLLQKYAGRVLLMATPACAVHCRYCFRRHYPYETLGPARDRHETALARIADDREIREVVLSGGDPLMLDDKQLGELIECLGAITHLKRLRLHSRLPVVLPARVTEPLCDLIAGSRLPVLTVIHANHPRELDARVATALRRLARAGTHLLNQSVLLRGVNDDLDTLEALSERLLDCEVMPYYLHQLDPVQGAAHFAVADRDARTLVTGLRERLPGYLVPRLVREIPGARAKSPL